MKKLILLAALAVTSGICSAQVSFGFQAGANIGLGKISSDLPISPSNDPKVGLLAGGLAEIPIGSKLAFRPELNFIQKGSKSAFTTDKNDITLNYIEVPLNVVYKLPLGTGNFFFGLGPSVAFGISGKNKYTDETDPTNNVTYDIKFDGKKESEINNGNGDGKQHLKAFDFGANILAGYKLGMGVFFKLGYTYDFMNINPDTGLYNASYKNSGFNIVVGYLFSGSKPSKKSTGK